MDRHFQSSFTSRLGAVNAEAVVSGEGGTVGDVSLGRYSTIIKPVAIPLSAPISHTAFTYTVASGENLKQIAAKFHVTVSKIRWSNTNLISSDVVATGAQSALAFAIKGANPSLASRMEFTLATTSHVTLTIYDLQGPSS